METFKSIIDKISEGLNFFDFSFFVSGFVTYVTLLYFFDEMFCKTIEYTTVTGVLASIVLSYVCGIISFSMGKWIRTKILWLFHWKWLGDWRDRDFDKTLINGYMQDPIFQDYDVDAHEFWTKVNALPMKYIEEQQVKVNPDTIYLNQFIKYAQSGKFDGLNNAKLRSYGMRQNFYAGIPEIFKHTKEMLKNDPVCEEYNIKVEHYIVSTGFAEVIRGTELMNYVENIWGCELIEDDEHKIINEIGFTMDNSTKTKAIFEINKGVNKEKDITVNSKLPDELRRVDFHNMIYIADGPSDIPAFSVVKGRGGATFAIYPKGDERAFAQVEKLREDDRIDMFAEADYSEGTTAYMWICNKVREFAENIKKQEQSKRSGNYSIPMHLV